MSRYQRVVLSIFTGLCVGSCIGAFYGWGLLSGNADFILGTNSFNGAGEIGIEFFIMKSWLMGISIAGATSLVSYMFFFTTDMIAGQGGENNDSNQSLVTRQ